MDVTLNSDIDIANHWLHSGQTMRICGLELRPLVHPILSKTVWCITKGQATVFFLEQVPQNRVWLLKKFNPGRRPTNQYLTAVNDYLPGGAAFFTCTQRRLLTQEHIDGTNSRYRKPGLGSFIDGAILMPKVPGTTWASIADDLRDGSQALSLSERLEISLALAKCISLLEAGHCSHRDLSSTNLFVTSSGEVFLIDWDCIYHPDLAFQANTTVGTTGYIAPFANVTRQDTNAAWSWCECADRFSLAVLIAEILLVTEDTPVIQEDGTLFSQAEIDKIGSNIIVEEIKRLRRISWNAGTLLERAFMSGCFEDCPTPREWIRALKATLDRQRPKQRFASQSLIRTSQVTCGQCSTSFPMSTEKYDQLRKRNKSPYCKDCFKSQERQWASEELRRNMERPKVLCEHCQRPRPISRIELNNLRTRAKPILCSDCLRQQLESWKNERAQHEHNNLSVTCMHCKTKILVARQKNEDPRPEGMPQLCPDCVANGQSEAQERTAITDTNSILGNLLERIRKWD